MKRSLKRLTALVLALSMTLSLLSATAWAADTETVGETTAEIVAEDDGEIDLDAAEESAGKETPVEETSAGEESSAEEAEEETSAGEETSADESTEESAPEESTGEAPAEETDEETTNGEASAEETAEEADAAEETSEAEASAGDESAAEPAEETDESSAKVSAAATGSDFYWNVSSSPVTCSAVDGDLPSGSTLYCGNTYYFNIQFNTNTVSIQTAKLYIKTPSSSSYTLIDSESAGSGKKFNYCRPTYTFTSTGTYSYYWYVVYNDGNTQTLYPYGTSTATSVTVYAKSSMTITKTNYSGTYDGSSHTFSLSVSGPSSYTIYYSSSTQLTSSNYSSSGSTSKPTRTYSGGTRVYYYVKDGTGKYNDVSGSVYIYIKPKVTMTAYSGTYNGSSHTFSSSISGSATLYYSTSTALTYSNYSSSGTTTKPTRTSAGTTTVYYIAVPSSGLINSYTVTTGTTSITINKASMTVIASNYTGTYDGSAHYISLSISGPSSFSVYYSTSTALTSSNYSSSGSTTKSGRIYSGGTKVYYYVKDNTGNYYNYSSYAYVYIKPKVTVSSCSGTYDGSSYWPTVSVAGNATVYYSTSTVLTYSNYSSSGTTTKPTRTNAGTTTVYYIAVPNSGIINAYTVATGSFSITINKATMSWTKSNYSGTYDGSAHTFTLTVSKPSSYTIYYSTSTQLTSSNYSTSGSTTKPTRTNVGTTTVYFYIKDNTGNYNDVSGTATITINKATMSVTKSNYSGTYDGSAHTFTLTVSKPSSYTIYYSTSTALTSSNYSTSGSTTKPTRTKAGTTTVYYYIKDNTGNYNDVSGSATITIGKIAMSVTKSNYSGDYDGSSHTFTLKVTKPSGSSDYTIYYSSSTQLTSSNYSSSGSTTKPSRTKAGTTTVYYYIKDNTGNYSDASGSAAITIGKIAMSVTKSNYSGDYDGSSHTFTLKVTKPSGSSDYTIYYSSSTQLTSSNYSSSGSTTKPSRTKAGTSTVYYYIKDNTGNYSDASGSATITIGKIAMSVSKSNYSGAYDGVSHTFTLKVSGPSDYTVYYSSSTQLTSSNYSTSGSTTKPSRKKAGTSTVYYYIKDNNGNYSDASGSATIKVSKATMTVSASNYSGTYDGISHTFTLKVSGPSDYTVYYSSSTQLTSSNYSTSGSTTKPSRKKAGTSTVYYYIKDNDGNYSDASGSATIKVSKATMTVTKSNYSGAYDGASHTFTLKVSGPSNYTVYYSSSTKLTSSNYSTSGSTTKNTRKGAGASTIYYYIKDNDGNYSDASGSATITVSQTSQILTASAAAASIYAGGSTTLTASTTGDGKITYASSDTSIATVSGDGKVTGKKPGTVTITVQAAATTNYKAASQTVSITVKLNKTTISSLTNSASGVTVKWSKVTGASGYYVYRNDKQVKKITSGSTVSYTDTGAKTNGTKYQYKVYAYYGSTKSAASAVQTTYFVSQTNISSASNGSSKAITVQWKKNAKATGYRIYISTTSDFSGNTWEETTTELKHTITDLVKGKTYYIKIQAYRTVSGTEYSAAWSSVQKVKVTK